jgi:hypothetical protein
MENKEINTLKKEIEDCFYGKATSQGFVIIAPAQKEDIIGQKSIKQYKAFYDKVSKIPEIKIYKGTGVYTTREGNQLFEETYFIIGKEIKEKTARQFLKETKAEAVIYNNKLIYSDGKEKYFKKIQYSKKINANSTSLIVNGEFFTFEFM